MILCTINPAGDQPTQVANKLSVSHAYVHSTYTSYYRYAYTGQETHLQFNVEQKEVQKNVEGSCERCRES